MAKSSNDLFKKKWNYLNMRKKEKNYRVWIQQKPMQL